MYVPTTPDALASATETHSVVSANEYRPDVDGLRAVAALAVVGVHSGVLPGGACGVDIFFVISGYLISRIILRAQAKHEFSFVDFYARRVNRIFPALIATLVTVGIVGALMVPSEGRQDLFEALAAGAFFVENISWYLTTPHDRISTLTLDHLWSLGVEEQYYLVWPLLTWAAAKARGGLRTLLGAAVVLSFGSFALSLLRFDDFMAFLLPWNRLWQLSMGGILAYANCMAASPLHGTPAATAARNVMAVCGAALLALGLSGIKIDQQGVRFAMEWPHLGTLIPTAGAFLLIAAGPESIINRRILSWPPLVFLGLISYPVYLWHWPLFVFAALATTGDGDISRFLDTPPLLKATMVLLSLILAYSTYRFIETPVRRARQAKQVAAALCTVMASVATVALILYATSR